MPQQLTFDLPVRPAQGRDAFFVSPGTALAVAQVDRWADWPGGKLVLTGPKGAGKTHLATVWAHETGAVLHDARTLPSPPPEGGFHVVEDVPAIAGDAEAEERLFHMHNSVLAHGGRLLLTGCGTPRGWGLTLPDLASRIGGAGSVALEPPDDSLLAALLVKLFTDRQIAPKPDLIPYIVARIERSHAAVIAFVERLDQAALTAGKGANLKTLARNIL